MTINLFKDAPELMRVAEAARDFVWEGENWDAYQESKESNSVAWPPEFLLLAQVVEEVFGTPPSEDLARCAEARTFAERPVLKIAEPDRSHLCQRCERFHSPELPCVTPADEAWQIFGQEESHS